MSSRTSAARATPTLALSAGMFLALAMGSLGMPAQAAGQEGTTLSVNGTGTVEVAPDRARVVFAVETEAEGARETGEANARLMDRVIAALRATGIPDLRIETSGYQLSPRYAPRQGDAPQRIAGYTARNTVQVIVDDVDAVGGLVDAALEAGANRVAGLSFEIRDAEPHRQEALRQAVARARGEAEVMAEALGMRLGTPIEVQGGAQLPGPRNIEAFSMRADVMMEAAVPTPVQAGLQTVQANVSIRYRLHP
jgi:uncharacterized protein